MFYSQLVEKIRSPFSSQNNLREVAIAFGRMVIITSAMVTGLFVGLRHNGTFESLELQSYDLLMRMRPDEGQDERLLLVAITEGDIQKYKQFPVYDITVAKLLNKLVEYQPQSIGLDILRDVPQGTGRDSLMNVVKQNDNIMAACVLSSTDEPGNSAVPGIPEERIGFADFPQDRDLVIRRSILISTPQPFDKSKASQENSHLCNYPSEENQIPSLGFLLALDYLESEGIELEQTENGELKFGSTVLRRLENNSGGYRKSGAEETYQILLNYRSAQNSIKQVTLEEVLEDKIDPDLIKDRIVLIGYTSQIANDYFPTPYSPDLQDTRDMPGVVIHAQSTSQILSVVLDNRPSIWYWSEWYEDLWILAWSLIGGILAWTIRRPSVFLLALGIAIALLSGFCYLIFLQGGWIPLAPPVLALLTNAMGIVLFDRFNKSEYGQAFYQGVRNLLKININIDEEDKQRQVEEITASDTFSELEQKADELRRNRIKDEPNSDLSTYVTPEISQTPQEDVSISDETPQSNLPPQNLSLSSYVTPEIIETPQENVSLSDETPQSNLPVQNLSLSSYVTPEISQTPQENVSLSDETPQSNLPTQNLSLSSYVTPENSQTPQENVSLSDETHQSANTAQNLSLSSHVTPEVSETPQDTTSEEEKSDVLPDFPEPTKIQQKPVESPSEEDNQTDYFEELRNRVKRDRKKEDKSD